MELLSIRYCFTLPEGSRKIFDLQLDAQHLELLDNAPAAWPSWTRLEFHQCPICPLTAGAHPHCPLAIKLVDMVKSFEDLLSHDEIHLEVTTKERFVSQRTSVQRGISSLMGLVIATSGCPHTAFLKPMARFHLPLASKEETIYRVSAMYLLAQYFVEKERQDADLELTGLIKIYDNIHAINTALAQRLQAATETDSMLNAIVILDMYTIDLPRSIEESLDKIRYLFTPFFRRGT